MSDAAATQPDPLLTVEDLAAWLNVSARTVEAWRLRGQGPPAVKVGRAVRFARPDVERWLAGHRERPPLQLARKRRGST